MQVLQSLSTKGRITLGAVALGFLAAVLLLFKLSSSPSWQTVSTGLDPSAAGKVSAALDERGIAYEVQNGGTTIAVQKDQASTARIALAEAGVNAGQQPGFELLDKQKLGSSSFQQQVAYQRALEGQIAQTIAQVNGVGQAQVRLSMPKDELFTDEEKPATAAVLLGSSTDMDPGAVRGIANLVASSVPGLKADSVTITDSAGQLMWPAGEGGAGGVSASKQSAQARYEAQLQTQIDAMLLRTLGPDKAQVQVRADLNVDEATREELEYADKGTPLTQVQEQEELESEGGGTGAAAGVGSNIPAGAAGAGGGDAQSNYNKRSTKTDFGVNKTVTRTRVAPGSVNRLSVSVMVDQATKPNLQAIQNAVEAAAGAQPGRDTVSVQAVAFAKAPEAPAGGPLPQLPAQATTIAKTAGIGIGALVFLSLVTRHLRRREEEDLGEPSWLAQLEGAPGPGLPAGEPGPVEAPVVIPAMADFQDPRKNAIENLVEREPERVAAQLRTWITEDR